MKKTAEIAAAAVFIGFLALFSVLRLVFPAREFSERENRFLEQRPAFTLSSLFSGEFTKRFESYITDQFPFRDGWTTLKARCELISGKRENNGVYYCSGALISRFETPSDDVIEENTSFINTLAQNISCPVYFCLIPGAAEIEHDRLPPNAPCGSQADVIRKAFAACNARPVDMLDVLSEHSGEYIFYRTDHHWTSLGAYYGYTSLCGAMGLEAALLSDYDRQTVSESFYGTAYSSSGFSWVEPDSIETFVPDDGSVTITNYSTGEAASASLYDESFLAVKDKYSFFLGGNTPRLSVDTGHVEKPKLCIIRDSYTDSLLPFLLDDFSRIDLIDLRYFKSSVSQYICDGGFDAVLVIYSVPNFSTDVNLFMLAT